VLREREVLETAAVLGDGGAVRILVAACGGDPGEARSALDTAARFGLVDAEELTRGRLVRRGRRRGPGDAQQRAAAPGVPERS